MGVTTMNSATHTRLMACIAGLSATLVLCLAGPGVRAQSYPDRPVKILVPYAPGGNTDAIARLTGNLLSEALGQQFVVENRPGASGALAAESVARSSPDGYTLLMMALPQAAIVPAMSKVKYDPAADFAPVSNIGFNPFILTVSMSVPATTVAELVAHVRAAPAKMSYASGGLGSHGNLAMSVFLKRAGIDVTPVHLRGGSEQLNNIMGGHLPMGFLNAVDVVQQSSSGKIRPLAVTTAKRIPELPQLPTMIEAGFPDFVVVTWNGLVAPKGTPAEIVERLSAPIQKGARDPAFANRLAAIGVTALGDKPEEFAKTIAADIKIWGDVVRTMSIEPEAKQ